MIRSLFVRLVEAVIDERQALAELHRANARRAEVVPFTMPATAPHVEDEPEFFGCSYRAAEAFMQGLQDPSVIGCSHHGLPEGKPCPGEPEESLRDLAPEGQPDPTHPTIDERSSDALLGTAGGTKLSFKQTHPFTP